MITTLENTDLMICDRVFKYCIKKEDLKVNYICGWIKPKNKPLEDWKKRENIEISTQRGSFERNIGRLVSKFKIIRKKYRGDIKYICDIFYFIMAIHNIEYNLSFIREYILNMNILDYNDHIHLLSSYFNENIELLLTNEQMRRQLEEERAHENEESISNFLIQFQQNLEEGIPPPSIITHQGNEILDGLLSPVIIQEMENELISNITINNNNNIDEPNLRAYNLRSSIRERKARARRNNEL